MLKSCWTFIPQTLEGSCAIVEKKSVWS